MITTALSILPTLLSLLGSEPRTRTAERAGLQDEVVMRVPVVRQSIRWPVRWVEKKGPKCIKARNLAAAALNDGGSIDFLLKDRRRIRARMGNECTALDFYGGFYLSPENGRICAKRDSIRNRVGQSCRINRFRLVVPKSPR